MYSGDLSRMNPVNSDPEICGSPCPVCGGQLVEIRYQSRCIRCAYVRCDSCEGNGMEDGDQADRGPGDG